jgi:hypothetical protein
MPSSDQSNNSVVQHRRGVWIVAAIAVPLVLLALGLYLFWDHETHSDTGVGLLNMVSPSLMPTNRLVRNLQSSDTDLQRESLGVLTDRRDPATLSPALPLLKSNDAYVWFNAALYLGSLNRQEAVPYLIKGLRHQASRSWGDCDSDLTAITGQNFGTDFKKWHEWWEKSHPKSGFDFDSNLGLLN